jgi:cephalosporin-C deacetylase
MTIAGLERFRPNAYRPPEFLTFWALTVAELQRASPAPVVDGRATPEAGLQLDRVAYTSLGGSRISGYLLRPLTGRACPLIVHAHGYNDRYRAMTEWARRGFNVFGFDARGFGRSAAGVEMAEEGYVLTGVESPETSILRGAVADYLQALRVAKELLGGQYTTVSFYGFSFGGALALMAAALSRDPDFVVLGQPTFGWNEERRRVSSAGSTREVNAYLEKYPWRLDRVMATLAYFDTLHFAPLVKAPALVGIGLDDDIVPSRTVLAVVNHLCCPVEIRLLPVSHSVDPRESLWRGFHDEWLGHVAGGLPQQFGSAGRQVRPLVA